ncbi:STAS domain-containing protein [Aliamphritea spongicola]|uniref:STAS domain-containing protein n=1 Tax=Aliamphritea spongicola TaxID=707589 RepID=UPI00196B8CA1|nr:STAS domain-containing protein [Aliamphritea spongicola]MBN3560851.1 STAS domain-containing protein [Aliamphritea spongicola]
MTTPATSNQMLSINLSGDFDALAVEELRSEFDSLTEQQQDVIIDMQDVTFIDSSGIGAIVFLFKRLRSQDLNLSITGVHGQPLELMRYLRIDKCISLFEQQDQA